MLQSNRSNLVSGGKQLGSNASSKLFAAFRSALTLALVVASSTGGAQLPSNQYDDYDAEKYQNLLQQERQKFKPIKDHAENVKNQHEQNQARVQNAKAKIDQLRSVVQSSQAELKQTRDQLNGMEDQRKALRAAIEASKNQLPGLESALQQANQEVASLEQQLGPYKGEIEALTRNLQVAQQNLIQAQNKLQRANQELNKNVAEGQRIDGEIQEVKQKLAELDSRPERPDKPERPGRPGGPNDLVPPGSGGATRPFEPGDDDRGGRRKNLEERLAKLQQRKAQNDQEIQAARSQVSAAESEVNEAQSQVAQAQTALNNLQSKVGDIQRKYTQAVESRRGLQAQVQQTRQELQNKQNQLEETRAKEQQLKAKETQLEAALNQARGQMAGAEQELNQAQAQLETSKSQLQAAREAVQQAKAAVDRAEARVQQVHNNIEIARRHLENIGAQHGAADGQRGGSQEAEQVGSAAGLDQGHEDGTRDGQEEAVRRARAAGEAEGQRIGNEAGTQDGGRQGAIDGERDGRSAGTSAGLKRAYKTGYDAGYASGLSTGSDTAAYTSGNTRGMAQGLIDAVNEAKPLEKKSYDETEAGYLNFPLKNVNVGDDLIVNGFKGIQQRDGRGRRGERRGPRDGRRGHGGRDGGLPHPRLQRFYVEAYENAFRSAFDQAYARVYDIEFDRAYQRAYNQHFSEYANQNRQDVYKEAYDRSYRSAYHDGYRRRYDVVYSNEREIAYNSAFNANKDDAGKIAEGQGDGLKQGSYDKGYKEGRANAYKANIEIEKQKAIAKGKQAADDLYQNNSVLQFVSMEIMDQDSDKFYRPGEAVWVSIKLKNFGLKSATQVQESLKGNEALSISSEDYGTGEVPAQSFVHVLRKAKVLIKPETKDGTKAKLAVEIKDGTRALGKKSFDFTAQYSVELAVDSIQGTLAPGAKKKIKITLKNRATTPQKVKLIFAVDKEILKSSLAQESDIELKKSETKVLTAEVTGLESGFLLRSGVDLQVLKDSLAWAPKLSGGITVAKKYSLNSKAKGLLISSGATAKSTSALYQSGGLDVWDYRVDTARMAGTTVEKYSGKLVQLLADKNLSLEVDVAQAVKRHYTKGGTLVIWGADIEDSKDTMNILTSLGLDVVHSSVFEGELLGQGAFVDIKSTLKGSIQPIVAKNVRGQMLLKAGDLSAMSSTFSGATKTQYGRLFVIGANPQDLGVETTKKLLARIESLGMNWDKKLTAAKASVSNLTLVFSDIRDEVVEAELDEKGLYYKDFGRNNRIQRLIDGLLFAKSSSAQMRDAVIGYYPYVHSLVGSLTKEKPFAEKVLLIKPDAKAKTWKEQYCLKFKDVESAKEQVAALCQ